MNRDKYIERNRYENRAAELLNEGLHPNQIQQLNKSYVDFIDVEFEKAIACYANGVVMEIGCGTKLFALNSMNNYKSFIATDISINSLKYLRQITKGSSAINFLVSDIEKFSVQKNSINCIVSAGTLSYGDNNKVLNEIYDSLSPGGIFIGLDSLNNNPIYRLNRYFHFLRGRRTKSTLKQMPNSELILNYKKKFTTVSVNYYGCAIYFEPFLRKVLKIKNTVKYIKWADKFFQVKNSAFKFIIIAIK